MVKLVTFFLILSASALNFQQQLSKSITIEWTIDNESIYIRFKCKITKGYCAIGFKSRMLDTDMIILTNTGYYVLYDDHYSTSHYIPPKDTEQGGSNDLEFTDGGIDINGYIDITVKRNLNTGDKYDEIILVDKPMEICWASKDNSRSLILHEDCGSGSIVFATTSVFLEFKKFGLPLETKEHVNLMCTFWSIVTVIGAISARYFKWTSWWAYVHFLSFTTVIIVTIVSSSKQYKYDKVIFETMESAQLTSSRLGFFILTLSAGQGLFGLIILYFRNYTQNFQALSFMTRAHKVVGWVLIFNGFIAIYAGRDFIGSEIWVYFFMIILLGSFELFFKLLTASNNHEYITARLKFMTHDEVFEKIMGGSKLMFADNLVIDIKHFQQSHPGGQYFVTETIGEDTGKYMTGCSSYGERFQPYTHSENAFSMLRYLAIAKIPYPDGYLICKEGISQDLIEFMIYSQQALNSHTYLLTLKSHFCNMSHEPLLPWLGKHFKILNNSDLIKRVRRYYSTLFVNLGIWGRELGIELPGSNECSGGLKLIYKAYDGGEMTQFLKQKIPGEIVYLQGPLGPGLMIKELKGKYLAFAAGTGLVPFLDLLYLMWHNRFELSEFSLTLYVSFRKWTDGFCLELLQRLQEKLSQQSFNLILLIGDSEKRGNLTNLIDTLSEEKFDRIWICGPSGFNRSICTRLLENGIEKHTIFLM